ncbi:MAG: class I SAM-dependent methyltransferase [Roseovarius sp.]
MTSANSDQAEYWSSPSGQTWVTHQADMDRLLSDVLDTLLRHAAPAKGERVLDIGCGTGASSLELSQAVGPDGHVTALDIADPLLALARHRGAEAGYGNIEYLNADAQTHGFDEGQADLVFSRFGVMFFADPVAAFANLRRAVRPGGRLTMICWQGAPDNPWFMVPMQVAMDRLGKAEPMDPHAPGPMAFKDVDRVTDILKAAGWSEAKGEKIEVDLIPPQTVEGAAEMATTIGPATRLIREKDGTDADKQAIREGVEAALGGYLNDAGLRVPARLIIYSAVHPA